MKKGVKIINCSRGGIAPEKDLAKGLDSGIISGVATDVFENEPLNKESLLWDMNNVIITPHNSFVSENNSERLFKLILDNINIIISNR